jgi:histidine ammonia-lyase
MAVRITGADLTPPEVAAIARGRVSVEIAEPARERLRAGRDLLEQAARAGGRVYGVTTGLGSRVVDGVDEARGAEFSLRTLHGRATAVGDPLPTEIVRAAMAVRLNGLCTGGAGASPAVAEGLVAMLNAGVHPVIPRSGSVGAADLCLLAHLGLGLIGEGEAEFQGQRLSGSDALERAGLAPVRLEGKDGLAICSSSAVSTGAAALALLDAETVLAGAQISAALAMEALRANLSPLDPAVVKARPAPGQSWAATGMRELLHGGALTEPGAARRLQDPLSFRCVSQIHGSLRSGLDLLAGALEPELKGAADNPVVLIDERRVLSTGNFHVPALALALDAAAIAVAQVAGPLVERSARLRSEPISGLPLTLVAGDPTRSGVAPLGKTAQALLMEIRHRAAPLAILSTVGADGVEDDATGATQGALRLAEQLERLLALVAIELVVACQALELAKVGRLGAGTQAAYLGVREVVAPLEDDRALGPEVERLVAQLPGLVSRVHAALR